MILYQNCNDCMTYCITLIKVSIKIIYFHFSPDGTLLASQGGEPDFMLTVWDWKQEKTVLRSKAFSQDVFRATFSTELEGQLTTSGTVHIRLVATKFLCLCPSFMCPTSPYLHDRFVSDIHR